MNLELILNKMRNIRKKLYTEGISKKDLLRLMEAPIDYEGPERMAGDVERKITGKQTPFHNFPAMPEMDRDFIELISSKRFKDSVDKVRMAMGDTRTIQGQNALMQLMGTVGQAMQRLIMIQSQNAEELEALAVKLVKDELGIPEGAMQFDAQLMMQPMGAAEGMKSEPEMPSEEEVEELMGDIENFNLERAKRRFINSLIQGAAFKGGHMYVMVRDEINDINPQLMNLYAVTQSLMEHAYWIFPDMEGMAGGGGGQMGQSEFDPETDPPTVKARAVTFPLLVHELVKGVYEVFGTHGLPDDPRQAEMVLSAEDSLPSEIWDSRLGPIFWEKFVATYPMELFEDDMKHIQHYLFMRFSALSAEEFMTLAKKILKGDPDGQRIIQRMVDEIVKELKEQDYKDAMGDEDEDEGYDYVDLSDLGL
jgi:hypothetical protein